MRKIKVLFLIVFTLLIGLFAVSCNKTVEFDYNIDFIVDGKVVATVGTDGDKISMPKNPMKEDYTFDGWYWDENEWNKEFTLNSLLDQPLEEENHYKVYAKWKGDPYTIQYEYDGLTTETVYLGEEFTLTVPVKAKHNFLGWYYLLGNEEVQLTDEDGKSIKEWEFKNNLSVFPKWEEKIITVKVYLSDYYNLNGAASSFSIISGEPYGELPTPSRKNYEFLGWYTSDGIQVTASTVCTVEKSYTWLYAKWIGAPCSITFDYDGGEGAITEKTVRYGEPYGELPAGFKKGYTFLGWTVKETDVFTFSSPTVLYAYWERVTVSVKFDYNGGYEEGSGLKEKMLQCTYERTIENIPSPKKVGYKLIGWYTQKDGGEKVNTYESEFTENTTVYAHWERISYNITLQADGYAGTLPTLTAYYGEKIQGFPTEIKRDGYIARKWRLIPYVDIFYDAETVYNQQYNAELEAVWEEYYEDSADGTVKYLSSSKTCKKAVYDFETQLVCLLYTDNQVEIASMATKQTVKALPFNTAICAMDAFAGKMIVALKNEIRLYNLSTQELLTTISCNDEIYDVKIDKSGFIVLSSTNLNFYSLIDYKIYQAFTNTMRGNLVVNREDGYVYVCALGESGSGTQVSSYEIASGTFVKTISAWSASYYADICRMGGAYLCLGHYRYNPITLEQIDSISHSVPDEYTREDSSLLMSMYLIFETDDYAFVYAQRKIGESFCNYIRVYDKSVKGYVKETPMVTLLEKTNMSPSPYLDCFAFNNGEFFFHNGNHIGVMRITVAE
ncbi:MAG: InlB B-repeat-containing protein [Clostridia bacterium]|nr:InlB B-repeat-containing protein [Clostridia bacterium]